MNVKIRKSDVIWSYIGYFFTLFTNVLILPFVMKWVSSPELGLWYTFLSVGQIASIFEGAFSTSISRNFTYAWSGMNEIRANGHVAMANYSEPNFRLVISLMKTCKWLFAGISIFVAVFFGVFGTSYIGYVARSIDAYIWLTAWVLYAFAIVLNLYYCYWITVLRGIGAMKEVQISSTISKIIYIVGAIAGLFTGGGIIALAGAYLVSNIIWRLLARKLFFEFGNIKEEYRRYILTISKSEIFENFRKIWFNAKKNGLTCVGAFAVTQATTLVCSAFIGAEETATYGICLQVVNAMAGVALVYSNIAKPKLTEYAVGGEQTAERFIKMLSLSVFIFWFIYLLEVIVIGSVGLPILSLLKPESNVPLGMFLFMSFYLFLENNHSLFNGIIEIKNRVLSVPASLISGTAIVVLEVLVAKYTDRGVMGLMFVQCIVQLCYNNWKWPLVIFREYHVNVLSICKAGAQESIKLVQAMFSHNKSEY